MVEEIVELPSALTAAGISIEQIQTPEGTTIVVSSDTNTETILEYSLDGVTYQSSSSFPGLPEGSRQFMYEINLGSLGQSILIFNSALFPLISKFQNRILSEWLIASLTAIAETIKTRKIRYPARKMSRNHTRKYNSFNPAI